MSRTFNEHRNCIGLAKPHKGKNGIIGKKWNRTERKMKPMIADRRENYGKLTYYDGSEVPICYKTKSMKLEIKNANRSVKKSERHKVKLSIKREIDENYNK